MTDSVTAKIDFLKNAKPAANQSNSSDISITFPLSELPNIGDKVELNGISPKKGHYVVANRSYSSAEGEVTNMVLTLGIKT
jgi:hypothetical protein